MSDIDIKTTIKIMSIKETLKEFGNKIIYIDDDTFFIQHPRKLIEQILPSNTVMYINEGHLTKEQPNWKYLKEVLMSTNFLYNDTVYRIPLNTSMWNAGVIGVDIFDIKLLDMVLALATQLHSISDHPYFYHDQTMFSFVFQNKSNLSPANEVIYHYCYGNEKANFNRKLVSVFKQIKNMSLGESLNYIYLITQENISNKKPSDPIYKLIGTFFKKRSIGLKMAFERVKKTKKIKSFFERGKTY